MKPVLYPIIAFVVVVCMNAVPVYGQACDDETREERVEVGGTAFSIEEQLDDMGSTGPGDGWGEDVYWFFDFSQTLDGEFVERIEGIEAEDLTSARLSVSLKVGAHPTGGGRDSDTIGIRGEALLATNSALNIDIDLLDHYEADLILAHLQGDGIIEMHYQDDAIVNAASLELVFEYLPGWNEPAGGDFSNAENWDGGEVPAQDEVARFGIGDASFYTVSFTESDVSTGAALIEGDHVIFDLNGRDYTLTGLAGCPGALTVGPAAGSALEITNGGVSVEGMVRVAGADNKLFVGDLGVLIYEDLVVEAATGSADLFVEADGFLFNRGSGIDRLGATAGTRGSVVVSGTGARWFSPEVIIGGAGRGTVTIKDEGQLVGRYRLAVEPGSRGDLTIQGAGSKGDFGDLKIGNKGAATMALSDGAHAQVLEDVRLAEGGGTADVTVLGAGTLWEIQKGLLVGQEGLAELVIGQGASIVSQPIAFISEGPNSEGRVRIEDPGSVWHHNGLLKIGAGRLGVVRVLNGGQLVVGTLVLVGGPSVTATLDINGGTCLGTGCPPAPAAPPAAAAKLAQQAFALTADSLIVGPGATFTTDTITFTDGAFLGGAGPFPFDIENTGTVSPGDATGTAGAFMASAGYTQTETGTLEIELGGAAEGDYDVLAVAGTARLGGTLRLKLLDDFVPEAGQTFEVVRAGSLEGTFATIEGHPQVMMDVAYSTTGVTLTVLTVTAIEQPGDEDEAPGALPSAFALEGNYPNPFNPQTTIRYALPQASQVRLAVFDAMGREVAVLVEGVLAAGRYEAGWEGRSGAGQPLPSGVYYYRLQAGSFTQTRPMTLMK